MQDIAPYPAARDQRTSLGDGPRQRPRPATGRAQLAAPSHSTWRDALDGYDALRPLPAAGVRVSVERPAWLQRIGYSRGMLDRLRDAWTAPAMPILVTGSHRSGTTWVGRMLATAPSVAYIHEPFHIHHDPGVCAARFDNWFTYVCPENESAYREPIGRMLRDARRGSGSWYRRSRVRPLIKDPLAVFSAPWLAARFATRNVVLIRHPAAFAGSLKEQSWTHPFAHFLRQPLLMAQHLQPFADDIRSFARDARDVVDQAALLWNVIHAMILGYQETHPDWVYVRHEDLSRDPVEGFRYLFERLDLELGEASRAAIVAHSFAADATRLKRDSRANVDTWKTRLTPAEIERVKERVWDVSRRFYAEDEW